MQLYTWLFVWVHVVTSANILGIFYFPSVSHQAVFQPIWKELSLRGHRVTVVTPNPLNDPTLTNLTEIDVSFTYPYMTDNQNVFVRSASAVSVLLNYHEKLEMVIEEIFKHPPVQKLIKDNTTKFDLVLFECLASTPLAFAERFKAISVGVTSLGAHDSVHDYIGNPTHSTLYPDAYVYYRGAFDLGYRFRSFIFSICYRLLYKWYLLPKHDRLARKYFGEYIPYLGDLEKNVSLILENTNGMLHPPRPNLPKMIHIGLGHLTPKKPLPGDLKRILDNAEEGFVYFSLGSNVRCSNLPVHIRKTIVEAISEVPYTVLWKWESNNFPGTANNVIIRKWLPQQDILGHPNLKVFVTQGGLQSSEEALGNAVPMVGLPFIGDQFLNVKKLTQLGLALEIDSNEFTKDDLKNAIIEVAENKKYKQNAVKVANILFDEPMNGLERGIWWIEYVLRRKGARHLRSPALDLPTYQYYLLDVISVLLLCTFVIIFSVVKSIYLMKKLLCFKKMKTA